MNIKKRIIWICLIAFILIAIIAGFLCFELKPENNNQGSLFNNTANQGYEQITQEQQNEEYQNREEFPIDAINSLDSVIVGQLSAGNFTELDLQLKNWSETYKDSEDQSNDESIIINNYRADIAYGLSILNNKALESWYFYNPETLAAVVAYSPISVKYKAFINRDSNVLPPAKANIVLHRVDLSAEQYRELLNAINMQRTDNAQFLSVDVFDMNILGYSCRLIEVRDTTTYCYQPYALIVNDSLYDITANFVEHIVNDNPEADLDSMFAAPEPIS